MSLTYMLSHVFSHSALASPGLVEIVAVISSGVMLFAALLACIDFAMGRQAN